MNALADVHFKLDIPEDKLAELVGRPDDDSDGWRQEACEAAEEWIRNYTPEALEKYSDGLAEVECER